MTKPEPQLVEKTDEMRSRTSSRFPRSDSEGHQTDSKSGSSIRREACERSCLANGVQHKKSRSQCESFPGWQMSRETQAHSDENPNFPDDSAEKQVIQEQAKISQSK